VLGERRGVALEHEQVDLAEDLLDRLGIERLAGGAEDLLSGRRLHPLVRVKEILMKFLSGARADDLDRDVALGLQP